MLTPHKCTGLHCSQCIEYGRKQANQRLYAFADEAERKKFNESVTKMISRQKPFSESEADDVDQSQTRRNRRQSL